MLMLTLAIAVALQGPLAIENVTVLPMTRDTALAGHTVIVEAGRIAWVGPAAQARVPVGAQRIDGAGRFLMPGLADMHTHLSNASELDAHVAAGTTTIRNVHGGPLQIVWRNRIARGAMTGPTIYTAGPAIGRGFVALRAPAEADSLVRRQRRAGYDMIKVLCCIRPEVYDRLLAAAAAEQIPVIGHVVEGVGAERSLAAGQASIEHINRHALGGDPARFDEVARAIASAGRFVGTILGSTNGRCDPPTDDQRRHVAVLKRAGVALLAGSEASLGGMIPGVALRCELTTLVAAGLTPYEALVTATRNAGEFARRYLREEVPFGIVAPGAKADLVLLTADPRADLTTLSRPLGTVLRGRWMPRA